MPADHPIVVAVDVRQDEADLLRRQATTQQPQHVAQLLRVDESRVVHVELAENGLTPTLPRLAPRVLLAPLPERLLQPLLLLQLLKVLVVRVEDDGHHQVDAEQRAEDDKEDKVDHSQIARHRRVHHVVHDVRPALQRDGGEDGQEAEEDVVETDEPVAGVGVFGAVEVGAAAGLARRAVAAQSAAGGAQVLSTVRHRAVGCVAPLSELVAKELHTQDAEDEEDEAEQEEHVGQHGHRVEQRLDQRAHARDRVDRPEHLEHTHCTDGAKVGVCTAAKRLDHHWNPAGQYHNEIHSIP
mmetsp:Transcript_16893/g.54126  ORF Transcript_16893/g.54126 Transcript_16893/m.54126 type:complete len:297 (+) Transcript_16893:931-1821(+)